MGWSGQKFVFVGPLPGYSMGTSGALQTLGLCSSVSPMSLKWIKIQPSLALELTVKLMFRCLRPTEEVVTLMAFSENGQCL